METSPILLLEVPSDQQKLLTVDRSSADLEWQVCVEDLLAEQGCDGLAESTRWQLS